MFKKLILCFTAFCLFMGAFALAPFTSFALPSGDDELCEQYCQEGWKCDVQDAPGGKKVVICYRSLKTE